MLFQFKLFKKPALARITPFFLLPAFLYATVFVKPDSFFSLDLVSAQTSDSRKTEADRLMQQGNQQLQTSQYQAAIQSYEQALAIYRAIENRNGEAAALGNLGICYFSVSQYDKAIEFHQQALMIVRQIGDSYKEAAALNNLGNCYLSTSQYDKAIEFHQQALMIVRQIGDLDGEARGLANLGEVYRLKSQVSKAVEILQQALAISRQVGNRQTEAGALGNLGVAYLVLSNYGKAIEFQQQALIIFRQVGDRDGEAKALVNLGEVYRSISQYDEAIKYYQQALSIFRQIGSRNAEAQALGNLGLAYFSWGQGTTKSIEYYLKALSIFRQVGDRMSEAGVLNNLGAAYDSLGNYDKAIDSYNQALAISRQIGDRRSEAGILVDLGITYTSLKQYNDATKFYQQALVLLRQIGERQLEGKALNNLGHNFLEAKEFTSAEKTLLAGITTWESLRPGLTDENKVSLFEEQARTYRELQKALIAQNKPEAALEIAERGRAKAFVELLAQRLSPDLVKANPVSPLSQNQIRQIAKAQNATLLQYSIIYDDFQIQGKSESRESALYIWVIQPTGEITFRQVDLKPLWQKHNVELSNLVIGNQEFLAVRSRSNDSAKPQPNLPTLHQLLIDPIADLLPKDPKAHVIFIPQGSLFQVPFAALQDANGTYLIQKHTILTAPAIQVLALTRQQKLANQGSKGNALVLGNPIMPSVSSPKGAKHQLPPLPGAEVEAKAIASLLNTQAIIGAQGTKAAIVQKMPQASIIHLATHGLLDDKLGLGSAIALGPSGTDNGWLTAEEILAMKLQANLVVLSACNTAGGRTTGDGVIGLSRSLISAGVPSVVVSLWSVPDAPTAFLMETFYQNLQKNPDKAQALRQAMLATMKTHPQPKDWAAFTLIGEAD